LALSQAMEGVGHCRLCRTLTEDDLCPQCADTRRDDTLLCVVEGPMDVYAVEQTGFAVATSCSRATCRHSTGWGRKPSAFRN
jgi:recombinational DNA repair protein RecR